MPTFIAPCRAAVAAALGLVVSLSLGACSWSPGSCSLLFIDGELVADNGRVVLLAGHEIIEPPYGRPVPLDWPFGWTVRPTDDGQLEVVDEMGTVRARTGAGIVLHAVADPAGGGVLWRDGHLVVCGGPWPDNYMDPDFVAPDGDAEGAP